jgi:hypothetical protein
MKTNHAAAIELNVIRKSARGRGRKLTLVDRVFSTGAL